ncbi:MAG: NifB/NifX family molybdenum-iron cluster-binding protein [Acidobacteriota bacterium]
MQIVAIPTRGGMVDEHFGHCESFTIITLDDTGAITAEERFTPPPQCGCKSNLVGTLSSMGVKQLIAGNMGEGAVMKLRQSGIAVVRGASGPVREAVAAWVDGKLQDRQELCMAHGHECHNH